MERLFNLDAQLLFDTAVTALNIFILFMFLSYMFSEPVRKLLKDRQERIRKELEDAARDKETAAQLKSEYEAKLAMADKDAEAVMAEAKRKAMANQRNMIQEAQEEAVRIRERAAADIELEKEKAADDMKSQMVQVATQMAQRVIGESIDQAKQDELIEKTLQEMGDQVWQN